MIGPLPPPRPVDRRPWREAHGWSFVPSQRRRGGPLGGFEALMAAVQPTGIMERNGEALWDACALDPQWYAEARMPGRFRSSAWSRSR